MVVVDVGSARPGERREMRLMKRVRFFGVFKPLFFGGVLGFKNALCLGSTVDGAREAVVAMDQRD